MIYNLYLLVIRKSPSISICKTKMKILRESLQVHFGTHTFLPLYLSSIPQELSFDTNINEIWALKYVWKSVLTDDNLGTFLSSYLQHKTNVDIIWPKNRQLPESLLFARMANTGTCDVYHLIQVFSLWVNFLTVTDPNLWHL